MTLKGRVIEGEYGQWHLQVLVDMPEVVVGYDA